MPRHLSRHRSLLSVAAAAIFALAVTGCGTTKPDTERGRTLFVANCGTCHTLAQAGSTAVIGPNLDHAFAAARATGMDSNTIKGVVIPQVEHPRPSTDNPAVSMPAGIVEGNDLQDVAAYVGMYAGVPGAAPPTVVGGPGAQVFASNGCGGCHVLAASNSGGVTGPNLDKALPGNTAAMIKTSIVDPEKEIAKGYPAGVMPATFGQTISPTELDQLVQYLLDSTSKGASGSGG